VLADDSVLFREGLARVLAENSFLVVGQAGDAEALRALVGRYEPDVVVTDIRMPPTNTNDGLLAALRIRAEQPGVGVLVLSQYVETRQAIRLLHHSPAQVGYLLKDRVSDITEFTDAVRRIARGGSVIDPDVVASCSSTWATTAPWPTSPAASATSSRSSPRAARTTPSASGCSCHRNDRDPFRIHPRQAWPTARDRRPPARPRRTHVHQERMKR